MIVKKHETKYPNESWRDRVFYTLDPAELENLAAFLGDAWEVKDDTKSEDNMPWTWAIISRADGAGFRFHVQTYKAVRLAIGVIWPRSSVLNHDFTPNRHPSKSGGNDYTSAFGSITVAPDREAKAVHTQITSRLMRDPLAEPSDYLDAYQKCWERMRHDEDNHHSQEKIAAQFRKIAGSHRLDHSPWHFWTRSGSHHYEGDVRQDLTIDMKLENLTPKLAEKIISLLGGKPCPAKRKKLTRKST